MTIRYVRDGLRVVRTRVDAAETGAVAASVVDDLTQAHALVRTAAANLRQLARLARGRQTLLLAPADPDGRRKLAAELGVDGKGIARARSLVGLSQRDLARRLDYSRGLVAECEHDRRSPPPRLCRWAAGVLREQGVS